MKTQELLCTNCIHHTETAIKEFCNNPKSPNYKKPYRPNQKACKHTKQKETTESSVITRMHHNIKAYNKNIPKRYLRKLTPLQLLHLVHEMDRREFSIELCKAHLVLTEEVAVYLRKY